ncbi:hypothetical protein [Caulobacter rhizosphaerae]|uniref:hypothetical protein n=1 Tax=Caulobacter rhizosphaerae TaxID=2010972 RepID=UPI0013D49360|nr:hypothetical protein [Caulobacter rhizosphaerae]GGL35843.1 hypothetical protein GCM10010983_36060 [Caulobacter rhizosphaerae]
MFKLIKTLVFGSRPAKATTIRVGEDLFDDHVMAYWDHLDEAEWAQGRAEWNALPDAERDAVIAWCDDRNAEGRLVDHRFYDQWLALRMEGYVGD